jgi:hypothetical protein
MKQLVLTKQLVHTIKQSIYLDIYENNQGEEKTFELPGRNTNIVFNVVLIVLLQGNFGSKNRAQCYKTFSIHKLRIFVIS